MKIYFRIYSVIFLLIIVFNVSKTYSQTFATDSVIAYYTTKVNPDSIQSYMQSLENFGTRFCLAPNRRIIAEWIMEKFQSMGYEDVFLDSFAYNRTYANVYYQTWQYNVICRLNGYSGSDSVCILGAHYDDIISSPGNPILGAPGADDNASGVAATLEIARIMKQYNYGPAYNIEFIAFAAEELGLNGSRDYAQKSKNSEKNIICMINNDMVSYCTLPEDQWKVSLQKYSNSNWFTALANDIIGNFTILTAVESTQYIALSDSYPFYQQGYKAVFFIEHQFTPYYHTLNDSVSSTNKYYAAEMTKISLGMLIYLNGNGESPFAVPEILYVSDTIVSSASEACFNATLSIHVAGGNSVFLVEEAGFAQFIAGEKVVLLPGTTVVNGGGLYVSITTDSTFCTPIESILSMIVTKSDNSVDYELFVQSKKIRIFPNPTKGKVLIELADPAHTIVHVEVYNLEGVCLKKSDTTYGATLNINLYDVSSGIYIVKILTDSNIASGKVVKY